MVFRDNDRLYFFNRNDISAVTPTSNGMLVSLRHSAVSGGQSTSHNGGVIVPTVVGEAIINRLSQEVIDL